MRNKIAGNIELKKNICNLDFVYHKYYAPQNKMERDLFSELCFKHTIAEQKGLYKANINEHISIFAVKFISGINEFPFLSQINNAVYKEGCILLGIDTKEQAYFMPVL